MNRLLATLAIMVFVVAGLAILTVLTVPVIIRELSYFIDDFPLYVRRMHMLATDPGHPWLSRIVGEGLGETERSIGELTRFASGWFDCHPPIGVVGRTSLDLDPIAWRRGANRACYLLLDWDKMIATIDNWNRRYIGKRCGRLRAKSTKRSADSCAGKAPCALSSQYTMPSH